MDEIERRPPGDKSHAPVIVVDVVYALFSSIREGVVGGGGRGELKLRGQFLTPDHDSVIPREMTTVQS